MIPVDERARTTAARPVYALPDGGDASGGGATAAPAPGTMRWIIDTGSGYDLIARAHLTVDDDDFIEPARAVPLDTANGWTHVTEKCRLQNQFFFKKSLRLSWSPPLRC